MTDVRRPARAGNAELDEIEIAAPIGTFYDPGQGACVEGTDVSHGPFFGRKEPPSRRDDRKHEGERACPADKHRDRSGDDGRTSNFAVEDVRVKGWTASALTSAKEIEGTPDRDKSRNTVMSRATIERQVIEEDVPGATHAVAGPATDATLPNSAKGSPELERRMSRTEAMRQDARRLKSVTLGRMGKMFRQRPPTPVRDKSNAVADPGETKSSDDGSAYSEHPSRKERTNSLGRMLKLVDKDGAPKKLFTHPRAGSLSRMLRKHASSDDGEESGKPPEDPGRGIFSRMFDQLRGRSANRSSPAEPNVRETRKTNDASLPPKVPLSLRMTSSRSSPTTPPRTGEGTPRVEYSA